LLYTTQNINLNGAYVAEKQGQGAEHNSGTRKRKTIEYSSFLQCVHFERLGMADCGRNM
jgi:hypothetical protein